MSLSEGIIEFSSLLDNERLDVFCSLLDDSLSRAYVQKLIKEDKITVNGKKVKASYKLKAKDQVTIDYSLPQTISAEPEDIPLDILYEDDDLLIVNKPKGMAVHPAPGSLDHTLVNALLYHTNNLSNLNGEIRPGIVHRIDKDTTGILVVAKNDLAHRKLASQLEDHSMKREYIGLVRGIIPENKGKIDMGIKRDPNNRIRMAVGRDGKEATTHFEVLKRYSEGYTLCRFRLETGRTHQIRVHMKEIGYPLVGDSVYSNLKNDLAEGQLLHAESLGFIHPSTGEYVEFESELPKEFKEILTSLNEIKS